MTDNVANKIIDLLERRGPVHLNEGQDYQYMDAGHVDSVSVIQFILELEESFNITLDPQETGSKEFRSLKGLVGLIKTKL